MSMTWDGCGPWVCDGCGKQITNVFEMKLCWQSRMDDTTNRLIVRNLSIVHHNAHSPQARNQKCNPDQPEDGSLSWGVSDIHIETEPEAADSFVRLLRLTAETDCNVSEIHSVIMRLFVPGYEQARLHFTEFFEGTDYDQTIPPGYFQQRLLQHVLAEVTDRA
jgi:hypothetical protein